MTANLCCFMVTIILWSELPTNANMLTCLQNRKKWQYYEVFLSSENLAKWRVTMLSSFTVTFIASHLGSFAVSKFLTTIHKTGQHYLAGLKSFCVTALDDRRTCSNSYLLNMDVVAHLGWSFRFGLMWLFRIFLFLTGCPSLIQIVLVPIPYISSPQNGFGS
jgi:hypothetical protein